MAKIKVCETCENAHWEDQKCPNCNPVELFTKEECDFLELELNKIGSFCAQVLVKGEDEEIERELKLTESIIEKVRKM